MSSQLNLPYLLKMVMKKQLQISICQANSIFFIKSCLYFFYPVSQTNDSKCIFIIAMINMNELYLQVKNKWKSLYPIYFDATKTIQEGRRLPKQLCIKQPTLEELARAVCACQLRNIIEPHKSYSRDYFQTGRLKVQLLLQNGKPVHTTIPNKKHMLKYVAKYLRELRQK